MTDNYPLVSVSCITYNHAPYIRQCLDGFMMQQTNFAFEVLIHDDASTDGTTDIIKEYEAKYPDIIKPIYEEENQWVKGRRGSAVFNFPRAKGKYIAMCEGDDYWTDPLKLQKQVDFLELHSEYSMCSHGFGRLFQDSQLIGQQSLIERDLTIEDIVLGDFPIQTATVLCRNNPAMIIKNSRLKYSMDASLFYLMLEDGKCRIFKDIMSIYRVHSVGVWSGSSLENHIIQRINVVKSIYEIEHTELAARYLLNQYSKGVGRKWIFNNPILNFSVFKIGFIHFGAPKMVSFLFRKILLGRNVIF